MIPMGLSYEEYVARFKKRLRKEAREEKERKERLAVMQRLRQMKEEAERKPKTTTPKNVTKKPTKTENIHPAYEVFLDWEFVKHFESSFRRYLIYTVEDEDCTDESVKGHVAFYLRCHGRRLSPEFIVDTKRHVEKYAWEKFGRKISL